MQVLLCLIGDHITTEVLDVIQDSILECQPSIENVMVVEEGELISQFPTEELPEGFSGNAASCFEQLALEFESLGVDMSMNVQENPPSKKDILDYLSGVQEDFDRLESACYDLAEAFGGSSEPTDRVPQKPSIVERCKVAFDNAVAGTDEYPDMWERFKRGMGWPYSQSVIESEF